MAVTSGISEGISSISSPETAFCPICLPLPSPSFTPLSCYFISTLPLVWPSLSSLAHFLCILSLNVLFFPILCPVSGLIYPRPLSCCTEHFISSRNSHSYLTLSTAPTHLKLSHSVSAIMRQVSHPPVTQAWLLLAYYFSLPMPRLHSCITRLFPIFGWCGLLCVCLWRISTV